MPFALRIFNSLHATLRQPVCAIAAMPFALMATLLLPAQAQSPAPEPQTQEQPPAAQQPPPATEQQPAPPPQTQEPQPPAQAQAQPPAPPPAQAQGQQPPAEPPAQAQGQPAAPPAQAQGQQPAAPPAPETKSAAQERKPAPPQPVSPQEMEKRLNEQATLLQKASPEGADRVAIYDLRWPQDADEYRALGKNAVILISAVTRVTKELPLKKVYLRVGERDIALKRLFSRRSELGAASPARKLFGAFREDALYLVPVATLLSGNGVFADFARARTAFRLNSGPFVPPEFVRADHEQSQAGDTSLQAVKKLLEREYPGYPANPERNALR